VDIDGVKAFHGHWCPGLALGIRVAEVALARMERHAEDEEIVAVVETDNCAVDAIQYLTGCTFGKGNLVHLDYGKNAFTFIRRSDRKAIRVRVRSGGWGTRDGGDAPPAEISPGDQAALQRARPGESTPAERAQAILDAPLDKLVRVEEVQPQVPRRARIHDSVTCAECGERVMETRARLFRGETLCIPCFACVDRRM
jgi:formylmethanofuran dehydrogenase subunit E